MMGKLGDAALGCAFASLAIGIIAIALPYWFYSETKFPWGSSVLYHGLWITCHLSESRGENEPVVCATIVTGKGPHYIDATRALEIIGLLLVVIAGIIGFLKLCAMLDNPAFLGIAGGIAVAAGTFLILGVIVFGAKTGGLSDKGATLHIGFALALLSGVLAVVAGGMFLACKSD